MKRKLFAVANLAVALTLLVALALGQTAAPKAAPKAAPVKAAAPKAAQSSAVDSVIESVKAGLSESLIIRTLQRENKPANLAPADLVKLKNAGVSEKIIEACLLYTSPSPRDS